MNPPFYDEIVVHFGTIHNPLKSHPGDLVPIKDRMEKAWVLYAFQRARGNRVRMAKLVGMNRNTCRKLLLKHGISEKDLPDYMKDNKKYISRGYNRETSFQTS